MVDIEKGDRLKEMRLIASLFLLNTANISIPLADQLKTWGWPA